MESVGVVYIPSSSAQSEVDTSAASEHPNKRRKLTLLLNDDDGDGDANKWRTHSLRRIYSTKLLEALRRSHTHPPRSRREVRDTADRVLASAARGSTRWSRAILSTSMRTRRRRRRRRSGGRQLMRSKDRRRLPAVEKRLRVLRRLVPGCRKVRSYRSILEEAEDYISALEMQVKAMAALAHLLSPAPASSPASPHPST